MRFPRSNFIGLSEGKLDIMLFVDGENLKNQIRQALRSNTLAMIGAWNSGNSYDNLGIVENLEEHSLF